MARRVSDRPYYRPRQVIALAATTVLLAVVLLARALSR